MNAFELIKTRKSVQSVLLDAKEHELSSPVIQGEELYIAATHSIF